ncbi:MAG: putative intracellular protease/amidase [Chloroflexi bacterium AL-N10]|nr:putative intracellular protease/amidase [Chloroflexi bacterium AL-N1]NOK69590.1 putative intracellular protease/amidase [Chloroflexi bacterium AL-N10]NOK72137.1 putative intracellular protease/amidase [Chloroflexi bacterium AL-N5]
MTSETSRERVVAILIYPGFTALDMIGPYDVLATLPDTKVHLVAETSDLVMTDTGILGVQPTATMADISTPDVFLVPGGPGTMAVLENKQVLEWIKTVHETSTWTTSVCTGSLILGAAGLLEGLIATTYWASQQFSDRFGATFVAERYVQEGKIVTAAGVSAGVNMVIFLASQLADDEIAQVIELALEYDPTPPFGTGSISKATEKIANLALKLIRDRTAA